MVLLYSTGFDLFGNNASKNLDGWTDAVIGTGTAGTGTVTVNTSSGRSSGGCMIINPGNGNSAGLGSLRQFTNLGVSGAHMYFGCAYQAASSGTSARILGFFDAGTCQVDLRHSITGVISVTRNGASGATLGSTSPGTLTYATYHYFEIDVVIGSGTSGAVTVKMDGTTILTITSVNTQTTSNAYWNQLVFAGADPSASIGISNVNYLWDDIYLCDATGPAPFNANLGDTRILGMLPIGAGTYAQMTKVGSASTHWQSVNEIPPDGDTTYVSSNVVNTVDTYTYAALPSNTSSVLGVVGRFDARKDDAGSRSIETHIRSTSSGLEADSTPTMALQTSYTYGFMHMPINLITGLAWTVTDVNNMEFGPKVAT